MYKFIVINLAINTKPAINYCNMMIDNQKIIYQERLNLIPYIGYITMSLKFHKAGKL